MRKRSFDHVHLQWFAEEHLSGDPDINVDGDQGFEMVEVGSMDDDVEERDPNDGKVVLSPEEFESLKKGTDTASAFKDGLAQLGEVLNKQKGGDQSVPVQQPGESQEEFQKRVNERLFGDNPYQVLSEVIDRKLGPLAQQIGGITSEQAKDLMLVKDDTKKYFSKYKKDIEEFHSSLPRDQQANPRSWRYAYDEVLKRKQDDIISSEVEERFDAMFQKKLSEMGIQAPGGGSESSGGGGVYMESGGMPGHSVQPKKKVKKIKYTEEDKIKASMRGMDIEDYLLAKGRIE